MVMGTCNKHGKSSRQVACEAFVPLTMKCKSLFCSTLPVWKHCEIVMQKKPTTEKLRKEGEILNSHTRYLINFYVKLYILLKISVMLITDISMK